METLRNDSGRVCGQCARPVPSHPGGGRQAGYCSASCKAKAHRARAADRASAGAGGQAAELAELRQRCANLGKQLTAATAELAAERIRIKRLRGQLAEALEGGPPDSLRDESGTAQGSRRTAAPVPEQSAQEKDQRPGSAAPGLPPRIAHGAAARSVPAGPGVLRVLVGDVPIGTVKAWHDGQFEPLLPNGVSVYLGSTARTLEQAQEKLVSAYTQYAGYFHHAATAKLSLGKARKDGSHLVKWGSTPIGRVQPAVAAGLDAQGWAAYGGTTMMATLLRADQGRGPILEFPDRDAAAAAVLAHWRAKHPPTWGNLPDDTTSEAP